MGDFDSLINRFGEIEKNSHEFDEIDPILNLVKAKYGLDLFTMDREWPIREFGFKGDKGFRMIVSEPLHGMVGVFVEITGQKNSVHRVEIKNLRAKLEEIVVKSLP